MPVVRQYTLPQFSQIWSEGFHSAISPETIDLINQISQKVGASHYVKIPATAGGTKPARATASCRPQKPREITSDEDWNRVRNFQATKIEHKTGVEGIIDQIRLALNKLTEKTLTATKEQIQGLMATEPMTPEDAPKVADAILAVATANKIFSTNNRRLFESSIQVYSTLFWDLFGADVFPETNLWLKFTESFAEIETADPDKDYDRYCETTKINDHRKAQSQFYAQLTEHEGAIAPETFLGFIAGLLKRIRDLISEEGHTTVVDELVTNVVILCSSPYLGSEDTEEIEEMVDFLTKCKVKQYKSLTSKSVFMLVDLKVIFV